MHRCACSDARGRRSRGGRPRIRVPRRRRSRHVVDVDLLQVRWRERPYRRGGPCREPGFRADRDGGAPIHCADLLGAAVPADLVVDRVGLARRADDLLGGAEQGRLGVSDLVAALAVGLAGRRYGRWHRALHRSGPTCRPVPCSERYDPGPRRRGGVSRACGPLLGEGACRRRPGGLCGGGCRSRRSAAADQPP